MERKIVTRAAVETRGWGGGGGDALVCISSSVDKKYQSGFVLHFSTRCLLASADWLMDSWMDGLIDYIEDAFCVFDVIHAPPEVIINRNGRQGLCVRAWRGMACRVTQEFWL